MVLTEGKNREIRKILASFNLNVERLIRIRFGPFKLDNLKTGKSKKLRIEDYSALRNYWT
jgi:23S rRNA pseudouridine2605 synthase